MGGYTRAVSGQQLSKHIPVAMQQILYKATVEHNNWRAMFLCGPCQDVIGKGKKSVDSQFCMGACDERTWAGGRGIATVGAVARKHLVTD
jgi:hypothetical protein